jgi:hypothetical protein
MMTTMYAANEIAELSLVAHFSDEHTFVVEEAAAQTFENEPSLRLRRTHILVRGVVHNVQFMDRWTVGEFSQGFSSSLVK